MQLIYHLTTEDEWKEAQEKGFYETGSLATEGFIHCSMVHQIEGVKSRYFKNVVNLVVLTIDPSKLIHILKYEWATSVNENFPHIYGSINTDAVIAVTDFDH